MLLFTLQEVVEPALDLHLDGKTIGMVLTLLLLIAKIVRDHRKEKSGTRNGHHFNREEVKKLAKEAIGNPGWNPDIKKAVDEMETRLRAFITSEVEHLEKFFVTKLDGCQADTKDDIDRLEKKVNAFDTKCSGCREEISALKTRVKMIHPS